MKYKILVPAISLLLVLCCTPHLSAQQVVSGVVSSSDEELPLPGVNVVVQGTTRGTVTDQNGFFSLSGVGPADSIAFSYIGYISVTLAPGGSNVLNVSLEPEFRELEEIIVMAYSEKSRTEISSSVVSLSADEINNVTVSGIEDMLVGKVAGVHVQSASGQPGQNADIRIRGVGSAFSPQSPLIVVDGIIGGDYNPNDIETVTVLKDAGATGLYGSQAAAGVIIITTRQGEKGKTSFTFRADHGLKQPETGNFRVMNGEELYYYHKEIFDPAAFPTLRPTVLRTLDYDWINNSYKTATIGNYYLSVGGGKDKMNYFISADYMDDEGTALNSHYRRFNMRTRISVELTDRIKLGTKISGNYSTSLSPHWTYTENPFRMMPWDNPYDESGELIRNVNTVWYSNVPSNIFHSSVYNRYGGMGSGASADFTLDIRIFDWLTFSSLNSVGMGYGKYEEVESPLTVEGAGLGYVRTYVNMGQSLGTINLLKFNKRFGIHSVSGLAGMEGGTYKEDFDLGGEGQGILPGQEILSVAGTGIVSGNRREQSSISILSQLNYNLASRYFLTASFRRDGNSKFSPENKYGNFYTFAASWLISNEEFMEAADAIHYLKLRASYGAVGNETFPNYNLYPYFSSYSFEYPYNNQSSAYPDNLGNAALTWETSYPLNVGIDLGFIDRIEINLDVYNTITRDLLFQDPTAYSKGFRFQWKNVGEMQNRGVELAFQGDVVRSGSLRWNVNFNIGANQNKVLKLSEKDVTQINIAANDINQTMKEGEEAFSWYMPKWMGVDPDNGDPLWENIIYDEDSGEEIGRETTNSYAQADFQIVGSPFPDFSGGFGTTVSWKGLTLSAAFSYVYGNQIYNATRKELDNDGANNNVNAIVLLDEWSRWESPGDDATHPRVVLGGNRNAYEHSSRYLEDGSYLRMRNVKLSYDLPSGWAQKIGAELLRISVSGDNLLTFTNYSGMDSDVPLYRTSTWNLPGLSYFKYPISKQVILGIELKF